MLFTIEKAFEVKRFYEPILIGLPIGTNPETPIDGLYVCHKDMMDEISLILPEWDFDESRIFTKNFKDKEKNYEVHVYHYWRKQIVATYELDANLNRKGIPAYYKNGGEVF